MIEDKRRGQYDGEILSNTYGALTFGTPFDGWTNEVLVKTVDDDMHQSNLTRLRTDLDLGPREQELHAFMAAFNFSKTESEIHTFYETLKSPEYFWVSYTRLSLLFILIPLTLYRTRHRDRLNLVVT
jgi:hypothetical protein